MSDDSKVRKQLINLSHDVIAGVDQALASWLVVVRGQPIDDPKPGEVQLLVLSLYDNLCTTRSLPHGAESVVLSALVHHTEHFLEKMRARLGHVAEFEEATTTKH